MAARMDSIDKGISNTDMSLPGTYGNHQGYNTSGYSSCLLTLSHDFTTNCGPFIADFSLTGNVIDF